MQLKNSFVLFTALTAGSAVARLHGHDRRHAHGKDVEKRAVGDMVYATINGVLVSWINEWSGHQATAAAPQPTAASNPTTIPTVDAAPTGAPVQSSNNNNNNNNNSNGGSSASASGNVDWTSEPSDGSYSREGFGARSEDAGGSGIFYKGNVGNPWGSNIIEVPAHKANQYRHVVQLKGNHQAPWTIVFWNKIGPNGGLNGWYGNSALTLKVHPGDVKYVAFDMDSQGGWGAAEGDSVPTDKWGGYASTWGEFDFGNTSNDGWSGWDVSAIQAQAAGMKVQGMKICSHKGDGCSTITANAAKVVNAYTKSLAGVDGIGGSLQSGAVRLSAEIALE